MSVPRPTLRQVFDHLILLIGSVLMCGPMVALFLTTTHPAGSLPRGGLSLLPGEAGLQNYSGLIDTALGASGEATVLLLAWNSFVLGAGFAALKVLLSLMAAYALTYFRVRFAPLIFAIFLLSIMLPLESRFLPTYGVVASLELTNTHSGMILPLLATGIGTFFFVQHLKTVPETLVEAARMDGAGPIRYFVDILVPMSMPMVGALFIVAFVTGWNQYLWPVLIASDETRYTLVRGLQFFGPSSLTGMMLACLSVLPPALLVILFQRQVVKGLFDGSH